VQQETMEECSERSRTCYYGKGVGAEIRKRFTALEARGPYRLVLLVKEGW